MNKKMSFILLLLCFGLLPSVAQASSGDILDGLAGAFIAIFMILALIFSIFSLIDMAIFHKLRKKLTILTQHSLLEIPLFISIITNYIAYLATFEFLSSFLDTYIAGLPTIIFAITSIIYFVIIFKRASQSKRPDSHRPQLYKPLKITITTIIITNIILSLFLLFIAFPYWLSIEFLFLFGGFLVPIQLVASFIFLKKEFKKDDSNTASPNIP